MGVYNQGPRIVELGHLGCRPGPSAIRDHDEFASKSWDLGGAMGQIYPLITGTAPPIPEKCGLWDFT